MKNMLEQALPRQFFVGFDPMLQELERNFSIHQDKFPPHDIIQVSENQYQIILAVAGFAKGEIDVSIEKTRLLITGNSKSGDKKDITYIYKGIGNRSFSREFTIQNDVKVNGAKLEDGILTINLERVIPKEDRIRKIALD